jgi:hypothetical protein
LSSLEVAHRRERHEAHTYICIDFTTLFSTPTHEYTASSLRELAEGDKAEMQNKVSLVHIKWHVYA